MPPTHRPATILERLARKPRRFVLGLHSGTSADGVGWCVAEIHGCGETTRFRMPAHGNFPFPTALRHLVLAAAQAEEFPIDDLCRLNLRLGETFAAAAAKIARAAGISPQRPDLIGFQGQTIRHRPSPRLRQASLPGENSSATFQIGEAAVLAARTGLPVVYDFRMSDLAAGGDGAPLMPYLDYLLFRHPRRVRAVLNLGGIGNITIIPADSGRNDITGFDTGPGNMIMDALVRHFTNGRRAFDRDGRMAARGRVDETLLPALLAHPFFRRKPPKSTGREEFGNAFLRKILTAGRQRKLSPEDMLATATRLTAESIRRAFTFSRRPADDLVISGGGAFNRTLVAEIARVLPGTRVATSDTFGIPPMAKEPLLFAILANEYVFGIPSNLPRVTGARRETSLGKLALPGT
ncbi:MAG: anhydro-N-acetylmuramic acid kinase [Planctomycetota bacterium]